MDTGDLVHFFSKPDCLLLTEDSANLTAMCNIEVKITLVGSTDKINDL